MEDRHPAVHRLRAMIANGSFTTIVRPNGAGKSTVLKGVIGVIRRWHGEGRTMLAVMHDFDTVRAQFPRTLVLARELVAHGPTAQVLTTENQFRARQMCEASAEPPRYRERSAA